MSKCAENDLEQTLQMDEAQTWRQAQRVLELLSSLNYYTDNLDSYLRQVAVSVSQLLNLDCSLITLCQGGEEQIMASSLPQDEDEGQVFSLHGTLTDQVFKTGNSLTVNDATQHPELGEAPEGYVSYLGVPLRTAHGNVLGTICSFCNQPRQFTLEEVRTAELFAERAATAIYNYQLYQQQQAFNATLEAEVARRTAELQAAQARLIEQERLAAVGQFAAMIVHEIRNPVTTMRMGLNYLKKHYLEEPAQQRADLALEEAQRLENLLSEILLFAKPQVIQWAELELNQVVQEFLPSLQEIPEAQERTIAFTPAPSELWILGDKDKLKQVLINLVRNACEAIAPHDIVTCILESNDEQNQVWLHVHNGGSPIPPDILPHLTQPFYSAKPGGTGLGLAVVKRIVESHGGSLCIRSDEGQGTTISVQLNLQR